VSPRNASAGRGPGAAGRGRRGATGPKVGLFGLLGSGNIGNEAQMETVLEYLRVSHPGAVLDAMTMGAASLRVRYGIEAVPLLWFEKYSHRLPGPAAGPLKALGKVLDAVRIASWVRRHDVVIVPGAGVLEATLPLWPWGIPYTMFLLCLSGKVFRTKVALVSVGANVIRQRATRWLFGAAARLAYYRSYRDASSREAVRRRGIDTSRDGVYADLAFGLPLPPHESGDPKTVGVGVMAYYGGNDDRHRAERIHAAYVSAMTAFTRWLLDEGYSVRLFGGDSQFDDDVATQILADVAAHRPGLAADRCAAMPAGSFSELVEAMAPAGTVVATRYHNVLCALKLGKPTISLGYSEKFLALMADAGLAEFCQSADSLDAGRLIEQFTALERRAPELRRAVAESSEEKQRLLCEQFAVLSTVLFPPGPPARAPAGRAGGPAGGTSGLR
jgi:polysaccharide pyruvyl transferase WcaK-like protein